MSDRPKPRALLHRIVREPLTHFVAGGALVFAAAQILEHRTTRYAIELPAADIDRLTANYQSQYGVIPNPTQRQALIDAEIRQRVLVREALALGLDRDDEIIRRRLAQKYEFLMADAAVAPAPSEQQLRDWFDANRRRYLAPERRSFDQVYFAMDDRGEEAARTQAAAAAGMLAAGRDATGGDDFPGPRQIRLLSRADTARLFGGDDFAARLFALPEGEWAGPVRSGFGWHAVRVSEIQRPTPASFADMRDDVRRDWENDRSSRLAKAAYAKLLARYKVTIADGKD